jgi:uncharacterized repeat protein (TIGR02543 family)
MKKYLLLIIFLFLGFSISAQSTLCASAPQQFCCEYVESVSINGVNFTGSNGYTASSGGTNGIPGYYDYTGTSIPIFAAGTTIPFSCVVKTNNTYKEYVKLWIDFNNNGNLEDPGELVYDQNYTFNGTQTYSANITVPLTAFNGPVRMRLIMVFNAVPVLCGPYAYGNTFDFGSIVEDGVNPVKLTVATNGTGTVLSSPDGIKTANGFNAANFAENSNVTLTATPTAPQVFNGWTGDITSSSNPLTVTMDVAKTLTANFAANVPGVNKYGEIVTDPTKIIDKNGGVGRGSGLNKNGKMKL